jgi:iron(III) transport system permease protein
MNSAANIGTVAKSAAMPQATEARALKLDASGQDWIARLLLAATCLFLVVFLLLPMGAMLIRAIQDNHGNFVGLAHFRDMVDTPAIGQSIWNSIWVSALTTAITVPLAFAFAYGLTRSNMPFKSAFRLLALVPLLAPSLLSALSLIQWFGNQGLAKFLLGEGGSIYGAAGIVLASVYNTFPHALMILLTSLALADGRLYEAADSLKATTIRKFFTVTLPGCKYGLISAATVVFIYVISDFGAPKVIGGNFNVLAVEVFKQVIGQQNFSRGAVIGLLLLLPSVVSFLVDSHVRKKLKAQLSARSVAYVPRVNPVFDGMMLAYCALIGAFFLAIIGMAIYTSLISLWPYNLSITLKHYNFVLVDGDIAPAFFNSLRMSFLTAIFGTGLVFVTAYLLEKTRTWPSLKGGMHLLAMGSMAVPGLVLGLGYIMFFNAKDNPLGFLYGSMAILVLANIVHYYTSSHLTAVTALKSIDDEFEAVSASLKVPFYKTFFRVTVPVCLPAILDIGRYFFVVSMSTLSCIVFLYSPDTLLAAVAIMTLDEAGEIGPASALACMLVYTSLTVCVVYAAVTKVWLAKTQRWRLR